MNLPNANMKLFNAILTWWLQYHDRRVYTKSMGLLYATARAKFKVRILLGLNILVVIQTLTMLRNTPVNFILIKTFQTRTALYFKLQRTDLGYQISTIYFDINLHRLVFYIIYIYIYIDIVDGNQYIQNKNIKNYLYLWYQK